MQYTTAHDGKLRIYQKNTVGHDFVVGDLHGCYTALMQLLKFVDFDKTKDRLFSVGDLIDRGSQNVECLKLLNEPWFHAVKGNHEDMAVASLYSEYSMMMWLANGGKWITPLLEESSTVLNTLHDRYLKDLPIMIVVGEGENRFNIVHAELYKSHEPVTDRDIDTWNFSEDEENSMLWGRTIIQEYRLGSIGSMDRMFHYELSPTFVGHTPLYTVTAVQRHVYIDTGCVFALRRKGTDTEHGLTMVEPATNTFWTNYVGDPERGIVESSLPVANYDPTKLKI